MGERDSEYIGDGAAAGRLLVGVYVHSQQACAVRAPGAGGRGRMFSDPFEGQIEVTATCIHACLRFRGPLALFHPATLS